jgi:hypothetical protein
VDSRKVAIVQLSAYVFRSLALSSFLRGKPFVFGLVRFDKARSAQSSLEVLPGLFLFT